MVEEYSRTAWDELCAEWNQAVKEEEPPDGPTVDDTVH